MAPAVVVLAAAGHDDVVVDQTRLLRPPRLGVEVRPDPAAALPVEQGHVDNAQWRRRVRAAPLPRPVAQPPARLDDGRLTRHD
jgi:hypothetical protein